MAESEVEIAVVIFLIFFAITIIQIPIGIAKFKKIKGGLYLTIAVLSWCALLTGISWFIALLMALFCSGKSAKNDINELEALQKLHELKEAGAISEEEYQKKRKTLITT